MNLSLFDDGDLALAPGAVVLRRFALTTEHQLMKAIDDIAAAAPFRHKIGRAHV